MGSNLICGLLPSLPKRIDVSWNIGKNLLYQFSSLSDAAKYFNSGTDLNYRHKVKAISNVIPKRKKTYRGCYWKVVE
jgi:hypothetical protein